MATLRWILALPFRILGALGVVAAIVAGFLDLWASVNAEKMVITRLGSLLRELTPQLLANAEPAVARYVHPALWDPVIVTFLLLPSWLALFILSTLILLVAQLIYRPKYDRTLRDVR